MNEYCLPKIAGAFSMTKLKNRLTKLDPELVCHLKNVRVNGQLRGCSGFVVNPHNGRIAFVSTDCYHGDRCPEALYREAESLHDYHGGLNHFCSYAQLPSELVEFLR